MGFVIDIMLSISSEDHMIYIYREREKGDKRNLSMFVDWKNVANREEERSY